MRPREPEKAQRLGKYKRGERGHGSDASAKKIAMLVIALVVIVGAGIALSYVSEQSSVEFDPETLCPIDRSVAGLDVILLDVSDQLTDVQILSIKNHMRRLQDRAPRFSRIEVYTLAEAASSQPKSFLQICNPGNREDMNRLYQNPELAQKRWETGFDARFTDEMNHLLQASPHPESPIYEAIQTTAVRVINKPEFDHVQKRLVIFSDLLQNVSEQSHYKSLPDFDSFKASDYFAQVRADLNDVDVSLFYITRAHVPTQGGAHIDFWVKYFDAQGAIVNSVRRVEGDR